MAQSISNVVTPQPGLVSPFLGGNPSTGGTTTPLVAPNTTHLNQSTQTATSPAQVQTSTVPTGFTAGAAAPNLSTANGPAYASPTGTVTPTTPGFVKPPSTPASTGSGGTNTYGLTPSSPNWYQLQPGESTANYYARTQNQTQASAAAGNPGNGGTPVTASTGSGTGGGAAPAGMMYNGQGQLVPQSSISATQGTGGTPAPDLNASGNPNTATGNTFNNAVGTEAQIASQPSAAFTTAQGIAQKAQADLQNVQESGATALGQDINNPIPIEFQTGRGANIQEQTALEAAPYAAQYGNAIQAEQAATGQQGTQQSGLGQAAGLVAPQPGQNPATQTFNPATGQYSGLAANSAGGTSGESGAQALENLGTTLGAEGAGANLVPLQQALDAGQGAAQNITSYLASNPSLNSSSLNLANLASQWASGQYSGANSAQYQTLGNYLTTFATQMAPLLAPGGTVTDASRALQQSLINGSANGQTISQVLAQLTAEAQSTLANRASGGAGGGVVSGGNSVTSVPGGTNPPSGGNTFGSFSGG